MPKPDEAKKEEVKESEVKETEDGGVEVDLLEKPQEEVVEEPPKKEEPKPEAKGDPLRNKLYAQDRIISRLERQVEQLLKNPQIPQAPVSNVPLDDLDQLAQKDWKAAVKKLAHEEAMELYKTQQAVIQQQQAQMEVSQLIEKNSQAVLAKYPELSDDASEKSEIFKSILEVNPRWRQSPDGPLLTMYAMEDELRKRGYDIPGVVKETEAERLKRVSASSLPPSKPVSSPGKIALTRDEKEFCDLNGISYADYARTRNAKGGVEV